MNARRFTVGDGLCARSVGSEEVVAALRLAYPEAEVVRVGCDGSCWAQPVVTVTDQDGAVARFVQMTEHDLARLNSPAPAQSVEWHGGQVRRVLARCGVVDPESIADARALGG